MGRTAQTIGIFETAVALSGRPAQWLSTAMDLSGAADDGMLSLEAEIARLIVRRTRVPPNEIGVTVGADALLFRSEQLAVALNAVTVFTTGVYLRFEVLRRRTPAVRPHPALSALSPLSREAEGDRAVAPPRVSVTVADGRSAVCTGGSRPPQGTTSADPALVCTHTSGHETREAIHYLLTPLPSPGPIVIALVWPEQGIPQTSLALDGDEVMAAAARVVTLWPGRAPRRRPPADPNGPVNN